jgi:hypothetical protein
LYFSVLFCGYRTTSVSPKCSLSPSVWCECPTGARTSVCPRQDTSPRVLFFKPAYIAFHTSASRGFPHSIARPTLCSHLFPASLSVSPSRSLPPPLRSLLLDLTARFTIAMTTDAAGCAQAASLNSSILVWTWHDAHQGKFANHCISRRDNQWHPTGACAQTSQESRIPAANVM